MSFDFFDISYRLDNRCMYDVSYRMCRTLEDISYYPATRSFKKMGTIQDGYNCKYLFMIEPSCPNSHKRYSFKPGKHSGMCTLMSYTKPINRHLSLEFYSDEPKIRTLDDSNLENTRITTSPSIYERIHLPDCCIAKNPEPLNDSFW